MLFDSVVLTRDLPQFQLRAGHFGVVVEIWDDAVMVEFFNRKGETHAILTVNDADVREPNADEFDPANGPEPWPPDFQVPIADATTLGPESTFDFGEPGLSHIDDAGRARMVDVTAKDETLRIAVASGRVVMQPQTLALLQAGAIAKGNVLTTAQIAGIMAAKRTHELIPMCHPLLLTGIDVQLEPDEAASAVDITATVRTTGKTGVEMEALTAVSVAGLTVYDMCKAVDRGMRLEGVHLVSKSGGASGDYGAE